MSLLRVRYSSLNPPLSHLVATSSFFAQSVAALKRKAAKGEAVMEISVFSGDWRENRKRLPTLLPWVSGPEPLLEVREIDSKGLESEPLKPDYFARRIRQLRKIELETQMSVDLEEGFIKRPAEFQPHDEEWAEPGASPNGGPATASGSSGVGEGPPSVS